MPRPPINFSDYIHFLKNVNYKIQDTKKFNVNTKITITCNNGHAYCTSITKIKSLNQNIDECPHCKKIEKNTSKGIPISFFKEYGIKNNLDIVNVAEFYNRWTDSIKFKCNKCDDIHEIKSLGYFEKVSSLENYKCMSCNQKSLGLISKEALVLQLSNMKTSILKENNEIIKPNTIFNKEISDALLVKIINQNRWHITEYNGTKTKSTFICVKCGNTKTTYIHNLLINEDKTGCIHCRNRKIENNFKEKIFDICETNNIIPLKLNTYGDDIHLFKCNNCAHTFERNCRFYSSDDFSLNCPECYTSTKRKAQSDVVMYIKEIYKDYISENNRTVIAPYELDIYIPEKKLAIEFCGCVWHSSLYSKDKNRHENKYLLCKDKDIRLITIFEDEWNLKKDICKSRIRNLMGLTITKIFARNCDIRQIENKEALNFCELHHIQGRGSSKEAYGAYFKDKLVSVMTFSLPSVSKNANGYNWELNRFCSDSNTIVIGVANRLLNQFRKRHIGEKLITFSDLRWGNGNVYYKLNFRLIGSTGINYYYVGSDTGWIRKHRFNFTKSILKKKYNEQDNTLTEEQIAFKNKLYRIYDCGHLKFEMIC